MAYKKMEFKDPTEGQKNLILLIRMKRYLREKKQYYESLKKDVLFQDLRKDSEYIRGRIETYEEILEKLDLFTLEDKMKKRG